MAFASAPLLAVDGRDANAADAAALEDGSEMANALVLVRLRSRLVTVDCGRSTPLICPPEVHQPPGDVQISIQPTCLPRRIRHTHETNCVWGPFWCGTSVSRL